MSTKLTITTPDSSVTVEVFTDGMTGPQLVDELVIPAMIGVGYHPNTVDDALASARIISDSRTIKGRD